MALCFISKHTTALSRVSLAPHASTLIPRLRDSRRYASTTYTQPPLDFDAEKSILYAERGIVVVNKPRGLICQRSDSPQSFNTLVSFLRDIQMHLGWKEDLQPVHRLDKNTTGSLILATRRHRAYLNSQFKARGVKKRYLAVVRGGLKTFDGEDSGRICTLHSIDNHGKVSLGVWRPGLDKKELGPRQGRGAVSSWKLLSSSKTAPLSLLELGLLTGAKHQLRVHLARILKAPVLGDTLYSDTELPPSVTDVVTVPADHIFLHARELCFVRHAATGEPLRVTVTAPLPPYFTRLCTKVGLTLTEQQVKGRVMQMGGGRWINQLEDGRRVHPRFVVPPGECVEHHEYKGEEETEWASEEGVAQTGPV
ncbi:hypothetical protein EIP91_003428 [Steccherinum ochraceum]|uniref:Pseudouridine synthase RsuA/RluA-like domain-containing protein n=1 Tax=Steccherinum ochraceum TaxID=92696 RepID=A0A4R0RAJ6_9APHY|nr:hypothetical protein EIP91_003428 [Steccherinum ochraceum]